MFAALVVDAASSACFGACFVSAPIERLIINIYCLHVLK